MTEVPDLPNNSAASRKGEREASKYSKITPEKTEEQEVRERLDPIVTPGGAKARKPSIGKRFRDNFLAEDAGSVWGYLTFDVVIPGIKNLMFEMVRDGFERLLWGDEKPRNRSTPAGYTSYNSMYRSKGSARNGRSGRPDISRQARTTHDFSEIIIDSRGEAEEVIDRLIALVDDYGCATVQDLYDLVGLSGNYTDQKWGWNDLRTACVMSTRGGYILDLPRPTVVD